MTGNGYGQYCPIARAAEILTERWVPLIVRELCCGSTRFNDLQRGVPRMSPALLSRRLKELERAAIIEIRPAPTGRGSEYRITDAGRELFPILEAMGAWAQRWVREDLVAKENLDPDLLMWDMRRTVAGGMTPDDRRFVVQFQFSGVPVKKQRYWMLFDRGTVDLCLRNPGFTPDLYVSAHIRAMTEVWMGHMPLARALRERRLALDGAPEDIRKFRDWFVLSAFAGAALGASS